MLEVERRAFRADTQTKTTRMKMPHPLRLVLSQELDIPRTNAHIRHDANPRYQQQTRILIQTARLPVAVNPYCALTDLTSRLYRSRGTFPLTARRADSRTNMTPSEWMEEAQVRLLLNPFIGQLRHRSLRLRLHKLNVKPHRSTMFRDQLCHHAPVTDRFQLLVCDGVHRLCTL